MNIYSHDGHYTHEFTDAYKVIIKKHEYKIIWDSNFAMVIYENKSRTFKKLSLWTKIYINYRVIIFPINKWKTTFGYDWDLLNGYYFGSGRFMKGFDEWIWERFNIQHDNRDELYQQAKFKLFEEIIHY